MATFWHLNRTSELIVARSVGVSAWQFLLPACAVGLFFGVGGRTLISRMIDGQFPAYERVIPKGNDKAVEFDRDRRVRRSIPWSELGLGLPRALRHLGYAPAQIDEIIRIIRAMFK